MAPKSRRTYILSVAQRMQLPMVSQSRAIVRSNMLKGIPSFEKYETTYGARVLLRRIILTPDLDDLMKRKMASNRNGVVGNSGMNVPASPSPTQIVAEIIYMRLIMTLMTIGLFSKIFIFAKIR